MINILLVEDQSMVREALAALIALEQDLNVVAQAGNGREALQIIDDANQSIDIVLSDIEMPQINGIELAEAIKDKHPQLKTIIVTTFAKAGYIKRAIDAGVMGFLLKNMPSQELAKALHAAVAGKKTIEPELAISALGQKDPLTHKERKSLKLASEGKTTQEISQALFLSEGTVRNYLSEAISKLNATNRIDAARIAMQKGWL